MEYLKITKASDVTLYKRGHYYQGDLHLTNHHLIFTYQVKLSNNSVVTKEMWISYPIIDSVELKSGSGLLDVIHLTNHYNQLIDSETFAATAANQITGEEMSGKSTVDNDTINVIQNLRDIAKLYRGACIKIKCKDFLNLSIDFKQNDVNSAKDVFESIKKLTCVTSIDDLYAFLYNPIPIEAKFNSWTIYDLTKEYQRQGLSFDGSSSQPQEYPGQHNWRITNINKDYQFCETYSRQLVVPKVISDNVLKYAAKFRSKNRIPCLTYYHKKNGCSITRSSQPLTGLSQSRSVQDEKLIYEIFMTNQRSGGESSVSSSSSIDSSNSSNDSSRTTGSQNNLIVDARPTANAMAQTGLGAGTEIIDNYKNCNRKFLGIDNIHVMRDSLQKINEILRDSDLLIELPTLNQSSLNKTNWIRHLKIILNGVDLVVKSICFNNSHVLVHCSDGWDRTAQICSLAEICLDPYFRTLEGFMVLVEKDWSSFGHRFKERSGHLSSETLFSNNLSSSSEVNEDLNENNSNKDFSSYEDEGGLGFFGENGFGINAESILNSGTVNTASKSFSKLANHFKKKKHIKFTSPVFQQFLDGVYQILVQFPNEFEFNERFLRRLVYHLFSCQYGNFLTNNEYEKFSSNIPGKTRSVWDYFLSRRNEFTNKDYNPSPNYQDDPILPNVENVIWWYQIYGRNNEEMNGSKMEAKIDSARLNNKLNNIVHNATTRKSKNQQFNKATRETNLNIMKHNVHKKYNEELSSGDSIDLQGLKIEEKEL